MSTDIAQDRAEAVFETAVGRLLVGASQRGITDIQRMGGSRRRAARSDGPEQSLRHLETALRALDEYFGGQRRSFDDLVLAPEGTRFQLRVWRELLKIPYGETRSYGQLARRIGKPAASRAVGLANGSNPIGIVIPCHRVIGADGSLTGYGGGLPMKEWLLRHEGALAQPGLDFSAAG